MLPRPLDREQDDGIGHDPPAGVAQHIARVAARLFASRGYDATSVREIVEAAGVTKPTLYYHFSSKEGLAQALLNEPLERNIVRLRELLDAGGDPVETLVSMIEIHFAFFREDPDRARFVYALFFGPLGSGLASEMTRYGDQFDRLMDEVVNRILCDGIVRVNRAGEFLAALRGLVVVYSVDYLYKSRPLDEGIARRLVDDLLKGFGST